MMPQPFPDQSRWQLEFVKMGLVLGFIGLVIGLVAGAVGLALGLAGAVVGLMIGAVVLLILAPLGLLAIFL
jgi:hypothetical protein